MKHSALIRWGGVTISCMCYLLLMCTPSLCMCEDTAHECEYTIFIISSQNLGDKFIERARACVCARVCVCACVGAHAHMCVRVCVKTHHWTDRLVLYCIVLYFILFYFIVLCCIVLYCIVLYFYFYFYFFIFCVLYCSLCTFRDIEYCSKIRSRLKK
jgi:hypothetical protein